MRPTTEQAPLLAVLLTLLPATLAARITLLIPASPLIPNPAVLPSNTQATLSTLGTEYHAVLNRRNTFVFDNVTAGSYIGAIQSRDFSFEPLRVDVSDTATGQRVQAWQTFRGNEWDNLGEKRAEATNEAVIEARVVGVKDYYQQRAGFSPLTFLKNPMIIMALVSMGLVFGMPKLIENMDDETRAEYEAMRQQSPLTSGQNPASQIQNFDMAGWLAGKSADSPATSGSETKQSGGSRKRG